MNINKFIFLAVVINLLVACGAEDEEAKRLGFYDAAEMNDIQKQGWHTKERWEIDTAKKLGWSSVEEMRADQKKRGEEARAAKIAQEKYAEEVEIATKKREEYYKKRDNEAEKKQAEIASPYARGADDIGLLCSYASARDGQGGPSVLIYSQKHKVAKLGEIDPSGTWNPKFLIQGKVVNITEIDFSMLSFDSILVKKINPNANVSMDTMRINRSTLKAQLEFGGVNGAYVNYQCSVLSDIDFERYVKWVYDNTNALKSQNKI